MAEKIGEIFLRKKLITSDQLDEALQEQAHNGKFLGELLVAKGSITERELLEVLSEQFNTRFVVLSEIQINPLIRRIVPKLLVWEYKFMPIEMRNSILLIAVSNPLDVWPMSVVQDKLDLAEVQTVLATKADIEKTIEKFYGSEMGGAPK
jgi:type IV pilus assembly protein PilB